MGICNKTHKDLNERLSCVQCMSGLRQDFEVLLNDSLDELSKKVSFKMVSNYMKRANYSDKAIESLAEDYVEKNPYGRSIYNYVRESFGILYDLGYRIVKKD
jgi:hypothetical protein